MYVKSKTKFDFCENGENSYCLYKKKTSHSYYLGVVDDERKIMTYPSAFYADASMKGKVMSTCTNALNRIIFDDNALSCLLS